MTKHEAVARLRWMAAHAEATRAHVELYDELGKPKPTIPTGNGFARSPIAVLHDMRLA
jgi:hypothetical protein